MNTAVELAREGQAAEALVHAEPALATYPSDASVVHKLGVIYYLSGEREKASRCFHRALELQPSFSYSLLELGNLHRDAGEVDQASEWYRRAAKADPANVLAHIRAAHAEGALGRPTAALELLARGQASDPNGFEVNLELARALVFHNRRADAIAYYERAVAHGPENGSAKIEYLNTLNETGEYQGLLSRVDSDLLSLQGHARQQGLLLKAHAKLALQFNRSAVIQGAIDRENSGSMQTPAEVIRLIKHAIESSCPLSLTRHGDGEGRFIVLTSDPASLGLSAEDADTIGDSIWWNWFGERLANADHEAIRDLRKEYEIATTTSDVLGMPLASRLRRDFHHFGYLAVLEDQIGGIACRSTVAISDSLINVELHRLTPFYEDILAKLPFLGVISPHPALGARLAKRLGITNYREYLVPGEMRLPQEPEKTESSRHFPRIFRELLATIVVPYTGSVFLVAAGLLGKIYCARIKSLGGIAIDVGSVVDAWLGLNTRPGQYDYLSDWRLPA